MNDLALLINKKFDSLLGYQLTRIRLIREIINLI
jgi:hypothetical protein